MHGALQTLFLGGRPDGFAAPPLLAERASGVGVVKLFFRLGVPKRVADDAVRFGIETGDEGPVVWEGDAREGGSEEARG